MKSRIAEMMLTHEDLLVRMKKSRDKKSAIGLAEAWHKDVFRDKRIRVTDTVREDVLYRDAARESVSEIMSATGLSAPTIRRIVATRGGGRGGMDPVR